MTGPDEVHGPSDDSFTAEELHALEAEPVPGREAMSTLLWAPGPATIALGPPVEGLIGDESE